jgi:hypothetical protein
MKKVVLDSGPWISALGVRPASEAARQQKAKELLAFLNAQPAEFTVYYSQRSEIELPKHMDASLVFNRYQRLPYHTLDECWEQIEGTWDNVGTKWDDATEEEFGKETNKGLSDKRKERNKRDHGIYGDAIFEKCQFLLHENPKDFKRLVTDAAKHGLIVIDLWAHSALEIKAILTK